MNVQSIKDLKKRISVKIIKRHDQQNSSKLHHQTPDMLGGNDGCVLCRESAGQGGGDQGTEGGAMCYFHDQ